MDRAKQVYNNQYERWVPWVEDQYLSWFTNDNKASYGAKQQLDKTKVTGVEPVDNLQGGVNNLVGGQVGKGGVLQPLGDAASKEGVDRAERGGKDDSGSYGGPASSVTDPVANGAKSVGSGVTDGAKGAGGYLGSFSPWGGKKEGQQQKK